MTKSVTVPSDGFMRFAHAHSFESGEGNSYDGGVIEYSTDGGAHWTDAGSLIEAGDHYGGPIFTGAGNPLSGRPAFVGESTGYGSTRLDLSSLAGQQIRFRFRIGTDEAQKDYGWFIDDIEIYSCGAGGDQSTAAATAAAGRNRERRPAPAPSRAPRPETTAAPPPAPPWSGRRRSWRGRRQHLRTLRAPSEAAHRAIRKDVAGVRSEAQRSAAGLRGLSGVRSCRTEIVRPRREGRNSTLPSRVAKMVWSRPRPVALTGAEARAALADDDLPAGDLLAGEDLHPEHVRVRFAAVSA